MVHRVTADHPSADEAVSRATERWTSFLMGLPGVVGVAVGEKTIADSVRPVIVVMVDRIRTDPSPEARIPTELDGVPVDVRPIGEITPH